MVRGTWFYMEAMGNSMNRIDRFVVLGVLALLACGTLKALLETATFLLVPGLVVAVVYGFLRAWQSGLFAKFLAPKVEEKREA